MFKNTLQTVAVASVTTLLLGGAGTAVAAQAGLIHTHDLAKSAVTSAKINNGAVHKVDLAKGVQEALNKAGKPGLNGIGQNGVDGAAGSNGADGRIALGSSEQFNAPGLALEAAPGADGSQGASGFGWDGAANAPVTSVKVGDTVNFTATALQPTEGGDGSFVLSFDSSVLQFVDAAGCTSVKDQSQGSGWVVCNAGLSHTAKGIGVTFKALKTSDYTDVNVSVTEGGETATQVVPVSVR